jgi:ABC-2 type transport system ATP-binding protein
LRRRNAQARLGRGGAGSPGGSDVTTGVGLPLEVVMADNDAVIQTDKLTKVYTDFFGRPRVKAVDELTLSVHRGEVLGLLGPNGSGKTTTTKLLLGLLFPTSGTATVLGKPSTDVSVKEHIGFLPEESYLYRFLDADETLDFYGRLFRIPRAERRKRIGQLIEMVGLSDARHRQLKEYSKGMSRRLGLAQALINDPKVIFLDEPTSGLDPIGSREVKDMILRLKGEGKTVLLCSHLLADVEDVCDRIAMLVKGRLRRIGDVRDLLAIKDMLQVRIKNPPAALGDKISQLVASAGGQVESVGYPTETLEDLFLKTLAATGDQAEDGPAQSEPTR